MSDALDLRRRQLAAWLAVADADPARHPHQRVALRRELALCRDAPSMPAYLRASDAGFEGTRAAWLDQQALQLRVAASLGQAGVAQAAWQAIQQALGASAQNDWVAAVQRGATALAQAQARQAQAEGGFLRTLLNLLYWHGGEPWQGQPWADAVEGWRVAGEADPSLAVAVAQGRLSAHPLAQRLPWRGEALNRVQSWLRGLPLQPATGSAPASDPLALQQASQRAWIDALQAPAPSGPTPAPVHEAPDPVAAALRQTLQDLQADAQGAWPEPLLQAHAADTGARLQACRNPLQAWQLSTWASACLALESDWQCLLVTAITLPLRAAAAVVLLGDALRPGLAKAVEVAHALTGFGPRALLQQAELQRRLRHHIAPRLDGRQGDRPVGPAEAGADLLAPLAGWLAMRVAVTGTEAATLCRDLPAALAATLDELGVAEPEPSARPVSVALWGRGLPFADWPALMARPPRPEVSGLPLPPAWKGAA